MNCNCIVLYSYITRAFTVCTWARQNRGIYMFRLDDNTVIDATMAGNLARYINHSCAPNCFAERFEIEREFKIVIVTNRRITRGEEVCSLVPSVLSAVSLRFHVYQSCWFICSLCSSATTTSSISKTTRTRSLALAVPPIAANG